MTRNLQLIYFSVFRGNDISFGVYQLKVNNRNTRARCEICLKLTLKTPERRHWHRSVSLSLNLNIFHTLF